MIHSSADSMWPLHKEHPRAILPSVMQRKVDEALSLARGDLDSFIVRAHAAATDCLKECFPKCAEGKTAVEREEMLRNDVPVMLWHDLRRLRIIRNKIEHES